MVASTANEAISNARRYTTCTPGQCLRYTRTWLEIGSYYGDAATAWRNAKKKHSWTSSPPAGAPVFWTGGSSGYGHIALSLGNGRIRTTDAPSGVVSDQSINYPRDRWGLKPAGWTEDVNTVAIPYLSATPLPGPTPAPSPSPDSEDDAMSYLTRYLADNIKVPNGKWLDLTSRISGSDKFTVALLTAKSGATYLTGELVLDVAGLGGSELSVRFQKYTSGATDEATAQRVIEVSTRAGTAYTLVPFTVRTDSKSSKNVVKVQARALTDGVVIQSGMLQGVYGPIK